MRVELTRRRFLSIVGFLILFVFTVWLYGVGTYESVQHYVIVGVILGIWTIALIYESVREWKHAYSGDTQEQRWSLPPDFLSFASVFVGAMLTFIISVGLGQGAVLASGLVGIFGAVFIKPYAAPLYCGAFVGMSSGAVFGYGSLALAGAIAGVVFVLSKHVFNGFGGKLGTIAYSGGVFSAAILGIPLVSDPVVGWDVGWLLVIYCIIGATLTFILSVWFGQGPVMGSGMVTLAAGVLLPPIYGAELGGFLAVGVTCATYAGMSGTNRFEYARWMVVAGVLCALILMYTQPYMNGAGGKLGTTAFGAVIGIRGLVMIVDRFKPMPVEHSAETGSVSADASASKGS